MSLFCSNTLIFTPECWKCILRSPDFKIFPETHTFSAHKSHLCGSFSFSTDSKAFAIYLKSDWKPCQSCKQESIIGQHLSKLCQGSKRYCQQREMNTSNFPSVWLIKTFISRLSNQTFIAIKETLLVDIHCNVCLTIFFCLFYQTLIYVQL